MCLALLIGVVTLTKQANIELYSVTAVINTKCTMLYTPRERESHRIFSPKTQIEQT